MGGFSWGLVFSVALGVIVAELILLLIKTLF